MATTPRFSPARTMPGSAWPWCFSAQGELKAAFEKQQRPAPTLTPIVLGHPADESSRIACRGLVKDWKLIGVECKLSEFPPGVFDDRGKQVRPGVSAAGCLGAGDRCGPLVWPRRPDAHDQRAHSARPPRDRASSKLAAGPRAPRRAAPLAARRRHDPAPVANDRPLRLSPHAPGISIPIGSACIKTSSSGDRTAALARSQP